MDHLFRQESGRMVATLTRIFGIHNLALAEDVVQDAFCRAMDVWKIRGVPPNPSAWLMATAKNRAIDVLRRDRTARTFAPELGRLLLSEWTLAPTIEESFSTHAVKDDQLRMMFTCCHPHLSQEAQVGLVLHLLCGFSVSEVASAFLSTRTAVEKRLTRSKKVLAATSQLFDLTNEEFTARLCAVQRAVYLLFNEGYHGSSVTSGVRGELCSEAMRLCSMLLAHNLTATPASFALAALMHLNAGRLPGRVTETGELISLYHQDRALWNTDVLLTGQRLLEDSATGLELSEYHVEAAIAAVHACAESVDTTDWGAIVTLYDTLMAVSPSPVVALNRAIAVSQCEGPRRGLDEIELIEDSERLQSYPFYFAARGELELRAGRPEVARSHFQSAVATARNIRERRFFEQRLVDC